MFNEIKDKRIMSISSKSIPISYELSKPFETITKRKVRIRSDNQAALKALESKKSTSKSVR